MLNTRGPLALAIVLAACGDDDGVGPTPDGGGSPDGTVQVWDSDRETAIRSLRRDRLC